MPLLLSAEDVAKLLDMPTAIEAMRQAFTALAQGEAVMPQRIATGVAPHDGVHLSMPCYVSGEADALAVKVVSVFPGNPAHGLPTTLGILIIHNAETGEVEAIADAEILTALRTGAASALATQMLAKPEAHALALFGAGGQARQQLLGVAAVRRLKSVFLCCPHRESADRFLREMQPRVEAPILYVAPEEALRQADIVCTATSSVEPVFRGEFLRPGTHVNAIGAFRTDMREVDSFTISHSRVYVDSVEAARNGAGDLVIAVREERWAWEELAGDLGSLLLGGVTGRSNESEITLFKSVGLAVQDCVLGTVLLQRAREAGCGQRFDF